MHAINQVQRGVEAWIQRFGVALLQIALGTSSLWFGSLKFAQRSPLEPVLHVSFPNYDVTAVLQTVGVVEVLIGLGLLLPLIALPRGVENFCIRAALGLLFFELAVILAVALFSPAVVFYPYFPFLTVVGEYLVRHIVFVAAGIVIAAHLSNYAEQS